jgi:heavy metal efflux system protein
MINQLIDLGLRNRGLMIILGLLVAAAGIWAYPHLPVNAFPDVSPNLVQVFTVTEGLAPEEIETFVTFPVEAAMAGLPGVTGTRSVSNFGLSVVSIYFQDDLDIYFARQLVGERLLEAREQIPEGFGDPEMGPISTGMGLILYYYLDDTTGQYSLEELRSMQDWLVKYHLQTVPGVTEVLGVGGYEKQFQVVVHPETILRYDITLAEIIEAIESNNLNVGAQFIEKNNEEFVVRSLGLATNLEDLRLIVLKTEGGTPVTLDDVADVQIGGAIRRGVQTRNGVGEVVAGMVVKLFGSNASTVIAAVEDKLEQINGILPPGVNLVPYYEQKSLVTAAVQTVKTALIQGIVLITILLLLFMGGLRPSLVVVLSLPFSVFFALLMMWKFGMTANLMSMGGLAIAIGMLVDGTIVLVENVDHRLRKARKSGDDTDPVTAGSREVARPILFSILIVILVFMPLLTLQGVEGKTFRPLAVSVVLAMAGSLIFVLFLAPTLSRLMLRSGHRDGKQRDPFMVRVLTRLYRPLLVFSLRRPYVIGVVALLLLGLGVWIFPQLGSEFTPRLQEGTILVEMTRAPSISLEESVRTNLIVERRLMRIPEVAEVVSRIGRGEVGAHAHPVNSGEVMVLLKSRDQWTTAESQADVEDAIRRELGEVPGARYRLSQPIEITVDELLEGVRAQLAVKLFGEDLDVLKTQADAVANTLLKVDGAVDVQVDQVSGAPQLQISVDRQAIARYGINVADVQQVIHAAVGGVSAGEIYEGIRRFDIQVRYRADARSTARAIGDILIQAPDGARVPLSELATIEELVGPRQITRQNNQRFIAINCNVIGRDIGGFVAEADERLAAEVDLPPGYLHEWAGQFRLQQKANRRLAIVVPITLTLITLLLFASLRSVRRSLLIMLNIPLALVGGIVALWASGQNLSVPASVGFIALFGIALGNGMVMVTKLHQLRRQGLDPELAVVEGACQRVRPVLMTALTTALGLLPLLISTGTGSEVQQPLATVVVGGLISSTLLTLLALPAGYRWFGEARIRAENSDQ